MKEAYSLLNTNKHQANSFEEGYGPDEVRSDLMNLQEKVRFKRVAEFLAIVVDVS